MADGLTLTWTLGRSALVEPTRAIAIIQRHLATATRQGLLAWEAEAARGTPVGVSGRLRSGWATRLEVTTPLAIVGELRNATPYAEPVERGAQPHWPPFGPGSDLARWSERTLGDARLAFVVARRIARGTTRGTAIRGVHMAEKALQRVTPQIRNAWQQAWRQAQRDISA